MNSEIKYYILKKKIGSCGALALIMFSHLSSLSSFIILSLLSHVSYLYSFIILSLFSLSFQVPSIPSHLFHSPLSLFSLIRLLFSLTFLVFSPLTKLLSFLFIFIFSIATPVFPLSSFLVTFFSSHNSCSLSRFCSSPSLYCLDFDFSSSPL